MRFYLFAAMFCLLVATGADSSASQIYYQESIDESVTLRVTQTTDSDGVIWWEETLPGNSEFGISTSFLSFVHSIKNIDPPVLPDGTLERVRLKLYLRGPANDDLLLTVDSLDLDKINRRHFLIGPNLDDSVSVLESSLCDGEISIILESDESNKQFALYRSVLDMVYVPAASTDVADADDILPSGFELGVNYPNPFNPSTTIEYTLPSRSQVRIEILNMLGKVVRTLIDESRPAGSHTVSWDGRDDTGSVAASGMYLCRIKAGDFMDARKMILLK